MKLKYETFAIIKIRNDEDPSFCILIGFNSEPVGDTAICPLKPFSHFYEAHS